MLIAQQVQAYLATFNEQKRLNEEEVFLFGHGDEPVRGICVCWMASAPALAFAARQGCNLVVCHEAVTFYDYPVWIDRSPIKEPWPCDRARLDLIEKHKLTVLRAHSTVDPTHVGPALWESLQLPPPVFSGWAYSHHQIEPASVADLAARMRQGLGLTHVRVTGNPARRITQLGTAWGGVGLDRNMHMIIQYLLPRGVEAVIVGETSDFAQRMAMESDLALLEGGHSPTEDMGMRRLAEELDQHFADTKVAFRPQEVPWATL
jgi:putative NIF3 family GTP cyclohydrolase 1 type 2